MPAASVSLPTESQQLPSPFPRVAYTSPGPLLLAPDCLSCVCIYVCMDVCLHGLCCVCMYMYVFMYGRVRIPQTLYTSCQTVLGMSATTIHTKGFMHTYSLLLHNERPLYTVPCHHTHVHKHPHTYIYTHKHTQTNILQTCKGIRA